ncbi:MAG TPA: bifunctional phosphoribosyl-AMP cyclohydrolase/phosphoribosyl-ATP diphosphatase HisIE [Gammaproteobacteria bacterium]|nr:bifunctional phosphoribosyl-AMP cyclohydrolase/phosphoribosyl-ATP diphosphatase HisIE [Gammaproteobacteria bacterium]
MLDLDALDFVHGGGLVTVVTQDVHTGQLLMVAHADREALEYTLATGEMHYRSRRRGLWHKGATSGNRQHVVSLTADCDGDAVLALVEQTGAACHNGTRSCFVVADAQDDWSSEAVHRSGEGTVLAGLDATISTRAEAGSSATRSSYTARLLADRNLRLKKLGEEAAELVTACADGDRERATEEAADLLYHALVALHAVGGSLGDVERILARRAAA